MSAERDAYDAQPPRQRAEREPTDLIVARAERFPVGLATVGRSERADDRGKQLTQLGANPLRNRRVSTRRLAQVPDAIADVPLLIVVNVAVAVDEPGQQRAPVR